MPVLWLIPFSELFGIYSLKALILLLCVFIFATFLTFEKKNKNFERNQEVAIFLLVRKIFLTENICEIAIDDTNDNWQYQKKVMWMM